MKNFRAVFRQPLVWTAIAVVYVLPLLSLQGAVDMFLKLNGIEGESTDKTHAKEIDVLAWSWGASNPAFISGGTISAGKTYTNEFTITKPVDKATPYLLQNMVTGTSIADATFTARKPFTGTTSTQTVDYIKIVFTDVFVTSVSTGGSVGDTAVQENVSFIFGKVLFNYTPVDSTGKAGTAIKASWDVLATK